MQVNGKPITLRPSNPTYLSKNMKTLKMLACTLALAAPMIAASITSLYNTGVNDTGTVLSNGAVDTHYALIQVPSGSTTTVAMTSGWPVGNPYLGASSVSAWVGPNNGRNDPAGYYVYRTTFDLTGFDYTTALITGRWATDNPGTKISLNNTDLSITSGSFTTWSNFSISSGFVSGLNTLDFWVNNGQQSSGNPTALRVEMTGTATEQVPDAGSSLGLLALALAGLVAYRRRS